MSDWIVSKLPSGEVEVTCSNRNFPVQKFSDLGSLASESASFQAFEFIEGEFEWGDRILTQEVKW